MSTTSNLQLPLILAQQAQKHITHNEALLTLDALVHLAIVDRDLAAPPASPATGARYFVASGASSAWSGHAGQIAAWLDGAWTFYTPEAGWVAWIADEATLFAWDGAGWMLAGGGGGAPNVNPVPLVGVNATADTGNRVSVSSPATLFNHEGNGHQVKVNKAAAADTASLLFQTGFSGRAEVGTAGSDDFQVKVSADGSAWTVALAIDRSNGQLKVRPGSAAVPSLAFDGDTNTGLLRPTADAMALATGGIERLRVNSLGRVGIGTDAPEVELELAGAAARLRLADTSSGDMAVSQAMTGMELVSASMSLTSKYTPAIKFGSTDPQLTTVNPKFGALIVGEAAETYAADTSGGMHLVLCTQPTSPGTSGNLAERLRITASGNVGIGTLSPSTKLDVAGPIRVGSSTLASLPSASAAGAGSVAYVTDASGGPVLAYSDGSSWRRIHDSSSL